MALSALGMIDNPDEDLTTGKQVAADMFDDELDHAVRAFQQHRGLLVDGVVGQATYRALKEASYRLGARTLNHQFGAPMYGDDVATLQARLQDIGFYTNLVDGYFGLLTHNALMSYQREYGLYPDGICGPETLRSLYFLGSRVTGGSPHAIREEELVRNSGPRLSGKRIIIDPGRGNGDHGVILDGPAGPVSEADILWDLARRLEARMTAIGMETFLSRPANRTPSDAERANTANSVGADLMISLRCATQSTPAANGVASFYFGNSHGSVSTIGRNLADFIQRELVARTGMQDGRVHGRTWDLLRLTRMPTVQVDIGYVTNAEDRAMLVSSESRDSIAEGMLAAVKRLYLLGKNDRPTGTFTFAELLAHEHSAEQARQA
ncbi:N-acetylmuramoyl-L-alanine amidase [Mycolicibacterium cyprinidarum]|uniref:N-acetylmuramoyl-L-alanine amidase n=1 Tax=Mycolicibacterium cyprinidarum TaxID=2860311 RepID=A0ABQ4V8E0_9MYCO|nr:N-acetylmuramoyl-L-alanine amidase [Mycolicibacterium sp. NGTWS1803]GJF13537.1 N-acetylmuramoyl-L-alanine amidase [Mycolicibacterium sp. NGTWSNA01]GJF15856.1 N-acetylmuramoyl-L-alanine amidase [Mycolicibacterium sp. NGTWS0302]